MQNSAQRDVVFVLLVLTRSVKARYEVFLLNYKVGCAQRHTRYFLLNNKVCEMMTPVSRFTRESNRYGEGSQGLEVFSVATIARSTHTNTVGPGAGLAVSRRIHAYPYHSTYVRGEGAAAAAAAARARRARRMGGAATAGAVQRSLLRLRHAHPSAVRRLERLWPNRDV